MSSTGKTSKRKTTTPAGARAAGAAAKPRVAKSAPKPRVAKSAAPPPPTRAEIAGRAYDLYVRSGYQPGREVDFWLEAERQLRSEPRR